MSTISRRLQYMNGEWYPIACSWGTHLYCWSWQPGGGNGDSNGMHNDAWSTNDEVGWSHNMMTSIIAITHRRIMIATTMMTTPFNIRMIVTTMISMGMTITTKSFPTTMTIMYTVIEPVPEASIIQTPYGYGGRRGWSLSQIRFNKCPPAIPGYATTSWRYKPSELRYSRRVWVSKSTNCFENALPQNNVSSLLSRDYLVWGPSSNLPLDASRLSNPWVKRPQ
jgi:hypothetical protein